MRPTGDREPQVHRGGRADDPQCAEGLALLGDTLWVTDIDRIRAFNARTGAPLDSVRLDSAGRLSERHRDRDDRRDLHHRYRIRSTTWQRAHPGRRIFRSVQTGR